MASADAGSSDTEMKKFDIGHDNVNKGADVEVGEVDPGTDRLDVANIDQFKPFPSHPALPDEDNPLTLRAVLVGWALGVLVNASNVYLGLKAGIANDANMFAVLIGYAVLKVFAMLSEVPLLKGAFGPKEHNIIQTVATATGGLSTLFVSAIPAMFRLGALEGNVQSHYWRLVTITASAAIFGSGMSVFFRKWFVITMAKDLNLYYPSASAVAESIRALHVATKDPSHRKAFQVLGISFLVCLVFATVKQYAIGIMWDWYPFWWFYVWGNYNNAAIHVVNWGMFIIEWTPAFLGYGMMIDINTAGSWLLGYIVGFGIIGPILVAKGIAVGMPMSEKFPELVTYLSLASEDLINAPSPRYWLLWPAVLVSIVASVTDVACRWKLFAKAGRLMYATSKANTQQLWIKHTTRGSTGSDVNSFADFNENDDDPSPLSTRIPTWQWCLVTFLGIIFACAILGVQYHLNVGLGILTLVLGFLFAVLAVQCTGQTGTSPISTVSSASQLIVGGAQLGTNGPTGTKILGNLAAGAVSGTSAQQVCEMTTDFKIGFLLGTPSRHQWYAQLLGCLPAIFLSPGLFIVFAKAYPCLLDASLAATCEFSTPAASTYSTIASAILTSQFTARSSWIFAIVAAVFTVVIHIARYLALKNNYKRTARFLPNMLMVALGIIVPAFQYGLALVMGAVFAAIWRRRYPASAATLLFPLAAGMIAGESISGIIVAIFNLAKISGPSYYGSVAGCPGGLC